MTASVAEPLPLDGGLLRLVDPDSDVRRDAVQALSLGPLAHLYALRGALEDVDGEVRALAAQRLCDTHDERVIPWLLEALADPRPSVREAAWRSLGKLGAWEALPMAARAIRVEETWWVRRAAMRAAAAAVGDDATELLVEALTDPFWRARYGAMQALAALWPTSPRVQQAVDAARAHPLEVVQRAARWIAGQDESEALGDPARAPAQVDDDPAVTTARLDADVRAYPLEVLVRLLGDPHEALRRVARRALKARGGIDEARASLRWLDEPRVPHVGDTVRALLDELAIDPAQLVHEVVDAPVSAGRLAWATSQWLRNGGSAAGLALHLHHPDDEVRRVAAHALLDDSIGEAEVAEVLDDLPVQQEATAWTLEHLGQSGEPLWTLEIAQVLAGRQVAESSLPARRLRALVAFRTADRPALTKLLEDSDGFHRALAVKGLLAAGSLSAEALGHALVDEDPRVRSAALTCAAAPALLARDPDPLVRRAALELLRRERHTLEPMSRRALAALAADSADPEVRAAAPTLLCPEDVSQALGLLLRLTRDTRPMVRGSAASSLEELDELDRHLEDFLATAPEPALRTAAFTWLLRRGDAAALERLAKALQRESASDVVHHLETLALVFSDDLLASHPAVARRKTVPPASVPRPTREPPPPHPSARQLGRTGVSVTPLIVSGAHEVALGALGAATDAGLSTFFWEPTSPTLTRFLRTPARRHLVVVGGSYHSGATALRRDVEAGCRALGRDTFDVFLLFWARSAARLDDENFDTLARLRDEGKVRAFGFSTHLRDVALAALTGRHWPVAMVRHSAAHPGAEHSLLEVARAQGTGVISFTATCYGRLLQRVSGTPETFTPPTAAECYQYSLAQPGIDAVLSAPRRYRELIDNLAVLDHPGLDEARQLELRSHGERVRTLNARFNQLVRSAPTAARAALAGLDDPHSDAP